MDRMESLLVLSAAIRGFHVYQDIWSPNLGDKFECTHEESNTKDTHAMGVYFSGKLVGHLPKEISRYFHYFTLHGGDIQGEVIGARRHCHEAGGMEIPSKLSVTGNQKIVEKLKQLIIALNSPSICIM